jgi:hypothetical protein
MNVGSPKHFNKLRYYSHFFKSNFLALKRETGKTLGHDNLYFN